MKLRTLHATLREDRQDIPGLPELTASKIPFVVVGAVALNAYSKRPRNTQDIDILCDRPQDMADYLHQKYPALHMMANDVVIKFKEDPADDDGIIDIMIPYHQIFKSAMLDTHQVNGVNIASIESLVALKFAAVMSDYRSRLQRGQDKHDIATLFSQNKINEDKVREMLKILYPGAPGDFDALMVGLREEYGL